MSNHQSKLEVSQEFQCSKDILFKAWNEPDQLKQWWKPLGKQLLEVTNDLTEGGNIRYVFDDNSLTIDGKYEKVVDQELLEYTWNWHLTTDNIEDAEYRLSVRFEGDDQNTTLSVTQEGFKNEESIHPHEQGWKNALQQLNDFLSNSSEQNDAAPHSHGAEKQKPPITGYNETPEQEKVGGA